MYHSLLVPLDGSTFGEHAIPWALTIAKRANATLQLVHVHTPVTPFYIGPEAGYDPTLDSTLRENARVYLEEIVKRLGRISSVRITSALLEGGVADEIHRQAVASEPALVVMTTHGRGGLTRFWLGSVADELVRRFSMPVLIVRPREEVPDHAVEQTFRHVLIPLDGSAVAEQILKPAVELGTLMQAEYTLFRVIDPLLPAGHDTTGHLVSGLDPSAIAQLRSKVEAYLEGVAGQLRARSLRVQTRVVVNTQPAAAILDLVSSDGIDLIALETHGRRGLGRVLLGSVADKVLRGGSTPVLLHRPVVL